MTAPPQCCFDGCAALAYGILAGICTARHVSMLSVCGEHLRAWQGFLAAPKPGSWVCGCGQVFAEIMTEEYQ